MEHVSRLTDEHGGEQFDRALVVTGEIRIGDRVYLQPDRIATVLEQGGDVLVRAGWRNARWLDEQGMPVDMRAVLSQPGEQIDRPIWIGRAKGRAPLPLRLVAIRKPAPAAEAAWQQARQQARKSGYTPSNQTLQAAGHQRHRGGQFQAAPRRARQRPLPHR